FQAEDGIRDDLVTGVQTCALPISGGLEEIIVTAQKRVENLQDVPISVQVLDTAKLEQLNIVNIDDYVKFAPGIAYVRGEGQGGKDRKSTRLNSSHQIISYAVFCLK